MLSMLGSISGLVSGIGPAFQAAGKFAVDAFNKVYEVIDEYIIQPMKDFFEMVGEGWESVKTWAGDAWEATGEFLDEWLVQPLQTFWGWMEEGWVSLAGWASDAWSSIGAWWNDWVETPIENFWESAKTNLEWLKTWANDSWTSIGDAWDEYISDPISDFFADIEVLIDTMKTNFTTGISIIGDGWSEYISEPIGDFFADVSLLIDIMKANFDSGISSIGDAWDDYISDPIFGFFESLGEKWDSITDSIETGWDNLTSIFDFEWSDLLPSWDWLDIIPGSLSDFFSLENLEMIWDGIGNLFSIAVQPIKDGVNFMVDIINDLIEYEFDYFFGDFSLSDAGVGTVPRLAKGGIVNKPTTAIIGEDGPEAVIPLTQRNNPGGVGLGGGGTYNITVNAGGITDRTDKRSLAREIGNMIQQEMARNIGGSTMRGRY